MTNKSSALYYTPDEFANLGNFSMISLSSFLKQDEYKYIYTILKHCVEPNKKNTNDGGRKNEATREIQLVMALCILAFARSDNSSNLQVIKIYILVLACANF
jgi:hypothetical protein